MNASPACARPPCRSRWWRPGPRPDRATTSIFGLLVVTLRTLGVMPVGCYARYPRRLGCACLGMEARPLLGSTWAPVLAVLVGANLFQSGVTNFCRLDGWAHLTDYAGTAWLLYPSNRFLQAKLRVWIDFLVESLAPSSRRI